MSLVNYSKAYKNGKKDYQFRMMQGLRPTLPVLDEMLPVKGTLSEVPLGIVQIPVEQIAGTKTNARSNSFAGNFMPILNEKTEFASKWESLCISQVNEGIREPIKAYEYMNKFYVEEGNKRVSVMKYFDMVSIPGIVTRIIPEKTEEKENKIYFEFLDFYEVSKVNYIWFTKEGSFAKLQDVVGKKPSETWSRDEQLEFSSIYTRFKTEFIARHGNALKITPGDAFLSFVSLFGYEAICKISTRELKNLITNSWEEFILLDEEEEVDLKMMPNHEKKSLLNMLLPFNVTKLKIAFIYEKTPASSAWTYAHELGRLHLEQTFPEEVETIYFTNVTQENISEYMEKCLEEKCNIIFTTTPAFVQESVKTAIANPDIRIVNCSLNTSHRYIRTYYARMYEAKFLMGIIAGAMTENNRLAYFADYPIYGTIANINAFARGVKMVNPRAKVYLDWVSKKDFNEKNRIQEIQADCISGKDMVIPEEASRFFGLYRMVNGEPLNLAMPIWHWGKFYEEMIRTIMDGTWKYDDSNVMKAINYWWGVSAGVIDMICSQNIPAETKRLVELLKMTIGNGEFHVFENLAPEEIITMDWLEENIIGSLPNVDELLDGSLPVVQQQGIDKKG